jgi:hypothetical protein
MTHGVSTQSRPKPAVATISSVVVRPRRDAEKAELLIETAMIAEAALGNACYAP